MKFGTKEDKLRLPTSNGCNKTRNQRDRINNEGHQVKQRRIIKNALQLTVIPTQEEEAAPIPPSPPITPQTTTQEQITPPPPQELITPPPKPQEQITPLSPPLPTSQEQIKPPLPQEPQARRGLSKRHTPSHDLMTRRKLKRNGEKLTKTTENNLSNNFANAFKDVTDKFSRKQQSHHHHYEHHEERDQQQALNFLQCVVVVGY